MKGEQNINTMPQYGFTKTGRPGKIFKENIHVPNVHF